MQILSFSIQKKYKFHASTAQPLVQFLVKKIGAPEVATIALAVAVSSVKFRKQKH